MTKLLAYTCALSLIFSYGCTVPDVPASVSGVVTGLNGSTLALSLIPVFEEQPLVLTEDGPFTYTFPFEGWPYDATVLMQQPGHICDITNGQGVIRVDKSEANIVVTCTQLAECNINSEPVFDPCACIADNQTPEYSGCYDAAGDTIVVLPDTQFYSFYEGDETLQNQMQWIVDNAQSKQIKMAIHTGDVTHRNLPREWTTARLAEKILDDNDIPHTIIPGNHDMRGTGNFRDTTLFNQNFGMAHFADKDWWGGYMEWGTVNSSDTYSINNYTTFSINNEPFLLLNLEYAPRKEARCWANDIIQQNPDKNVIISSHCALGREGELVECSQIWNYPGGGGPAIWNEIARRHSNVRLMFSGNITGSAHSELTGTFGNTVHNILQDYTSENRDMEFHGNGWLRTLTFDANTETVDVKSVSARSDVGVFTRTSLYPMDPASYPHQFQFTMPKDLPTYQFDATLTSFHDSMVNTALKGAHSGPQITTGGDGPFYVAWQNDSDANGSYQISGRGFRADGCEEKPHKVINNIASGSPTKPKVAMSANGMVFIAWEDDSSVSGDYDIHVSAYNSDGSERFTDITVNTITSGQQTNPTIAADDQGDFVVTWEDDSDGNGYNEIQVAGFNNLGAKRFGVNVVNQQSSGQQLLPDIATDSAGNFIVTWADDNNNDGIYQILAAGFSNSGAKLITDFTVSLDSSGPQRRPRVAMNATGTFAISWEDDDDNNSIYQIKASGFNSNGSRRFNDIVINQTSRAQKNPAIDMNDSGKFAVVWEDVILAASYPYYIIGAVFNDLGERQKNDFSVNMATNGATKVPDVALTNDGQMIVAWQNYIGIGNSHILTKSIDVEQ